MSTPERRRLILIGLSVACTVLLGATAALATTTFRLLGERSAGAAPGATSSPTPAAAPQIVQGIEVTRQSDLTLDNWTMTAVASDDRVHTLAYATITSDDEERAVSATFDFTAYSEAGRIIDRSPASVYLLPGQTSLLATIFSEDLSDAATLVVEQTAIETGKPAYTGEIVMDSIAAANEYGKVAATLTSTLGEAPESAEVYLVGSVGDEPFGICNAYVEVPAGGSVEAECYLEPVGKEQPPEEITEIPENAVFTAYVVLSIPW